MARFYCPELGAFFDDAVNFNIPPTARPVSEEQHSALMQAQAEGFVIVADDTGFPVAVEVEATLSVEQRLASIRLQRDKLLRASDATQLPDYPIEAAERAAWANYRQALRDLPASIENIDQVEWPVAPQPSQEQPA